ncbi:hypothetical protein [Pedobacter sp. B4-66]|uniref:hypothetical protein n=1 Tax=Pedobacter sp. B4-66 TaxID=2817280 RepID=UPI001BDAEFDA|nr:hypothetical protein [Pedobacter sp. B4-66]
MKLTLFFVVVIGCLQVNASGNAQTITLSAKNAPLENIFKELKKTKRLLILV